jgi:glycerol-1-phosphate dehydrogenase [NAD(P)+]
MENTRPEIHIARDAVARFHEFCRMSDLSRFLLIADRNTYGCLGASVEDELRRHSYEVTSVVFGEGELLVDARTILKVLLACTAAPCTFIAVGSGTITDIARIVSHRSGNAFVSLPTAPSVDGYSSANVPIMVDGVKQSFRAHAPVAVFADTGILSSAPRAMIAAGFGDMLGKYTSIADWRLGHLLWNEPFNEAIAQRAAAALLSCARCADGIGAASPADVSTLMEALFESGFCMTDFGNSLPASGTEHHFSHYWEMKLLREGRPPILHGAKVGVATVLVSRLYEQLRRLSSCEARELLRKAHRQAREEQVETIKEAFGPMAEEILQVQSDFLDLSEEAHTRLTNNIVERWPAIQTIANGVPSPEALMELLASAGGPATPHAAGLTTEDVELAARNAQYLRKHFTVARLMQLLYPAHGASGILGIG